MATLNTDFAYAVGRIRALQTKLLNQTEVERMLGAASAKEAYSILNELDYSSHVGDIENLESFQDVIDSGLKDTQRVVNEICPTEELRKLIWLPFDFHNIKTLIKARAASKTLDDIMGVLMNLGVINIESLAVFILDDVRASFGLREADETDLKRVINDTLTSQTTRTDPQQADIALDKHMYKLLGKLAKETGSSMLQQFIALCIDLLNIDMLMRMALQNANAPIEEAFERAFVPGGSVPRSKFMALFGKENTEIIGAFSATPYAKLTAHGIEEFNKTGSLLELERAEENYKSSFLEGAKRMPFGPEPVFAYAHAKMNNALIIRLILVGKLNAVSKEELTARIRNLY